MTPRIASRVRRSPILAAIAIVAGVVNATPPRTTGSEGGWIERARSAASCSAPPERAAATSLSSAAGLPEPASAMAASWRASVTRSASSVVASAWPRAGPAPARGARLSLGALTTSASAVRAPFVVEPRREPLHRGEQRARVSARDALVGQPRVEASRAARAHRPFEEGERLERCASRRRARGPGAGRRHRAIA